MKVKAGAASVQVPLKFITTATGAEATVDHATAGLVLWYWRPGSARVLITPFVNLADLNAAFAAGGVEPIGNGESRVDVPNAAFAAGVDYVTIGGGATGITAIPTTVEIDANTNADIYDRIGPPAGASIAADIAAILAEGIQNWSAIPASHEGEIQVGSSTTTLALESGALELPGAYVGQYVAVITPLSVFWGRVESYDHVAKEVTLDEPLPFTPAQVAPLDQYKIVGYGAVIANAIADGAITGATISSAGITAIQSGVATAAILDALVDRVILIMAALGVTRLERDGTELTGYAEDLTTPIATWNLSATTGPVSRIRTS